MLFPQNEQEDAIRNFRQGQLNLLISTSVAEEGLDIPQCNLVVRYGLLTNEIAQKQAVGRARASNSRYSVVAQEGGRELCRERVNDHLEVLTDEAVAKIQAMSPAEFRRKVRDSHPLPRSPHRPALPLNPLFCPSSVVQIAELQREAMEKRKLSESQNEERRRGNAAAQVRFLCRDCFEPVAFGSDMRLIDNMHYVNVNLGFK